MSKLVLITGPTNSGKSRWAEHLLRKTDNVTYIATLNNEYIDSKMEIRISKHKKRRPSSWDILETNLILKALANISSTNSILIESLGGVVSSNLELSEREWETLCNDMISCFKKHKSTILIVAEEVSWGVVPSTETGNTFRDRLSSLTLQIEHISSDSWLVVNGRALNLKENTTKVPI